MKSIRIPLPESKTEEMLFLARKVLDKHLEDGDKSPLKDMDWERLRLKIEKALAFHANAESYRVQRKICIEERNKLLSDITEGVRGCRNVLSGVRMNSMQTLGEWGFTVIESTVSKAKAAPPAVEPVKPAQPPENDTKV